ncbi:MAG: Ig-like domain-containing protein [Fimbriimonadia bacterium]|nr:Ig-like domain-containing protein [Fimbriimonadia bacterium]
MVKRSFASLLRLSFAYRLGLVIGWFMSSSISPNAQTFTLIEPPLGYENYSSSQGVSADGAAIPLAAQHNSTGHYRGFLWTRHGGLQDLGLPNDVVHSVPYAISSDGSTVVGLLSASSINVGFPGTSFRWTATQGMQNLGNFGYLKSHAISVSRDGTILCGTLNDWQKAFFWSLQNGFQILDSIGYSYTYANAISEDGTVVVGAGMIGGYERATRWRLNYGGAIENLGFLPGGNFWSSARGVSSDGTFIVGGALNAASQGRAFRFASMVPPFGMQDLGALPGLPHSLAESVTEDGSCVVGIAYQSGAPLSSHRAFIWTEDDGMRDMNEAFSSIVPNGWTLVAAKAISADGRYIAGTAYQAATQRYKGFVIGTNFLGVGNATIDASPLAVPANNSSISTITLTYKRSSGNPISGRTIRFTSRRGGIDTFSTATVVTNAQGQASVTVRSGTIGEAIINCRDETVGQDLAAEQMIRFFDPNSTSPILESVKALVHGPFLSGVDVENSFTARVATWGAEAGPGRIEFRLNNQVFSVPTNTMEASKAFNMGRDLISDTCLTNNDLVVVAINNRGEVSIPNVRTLRSVDPPSWMREAGIVSSVQGVGFEKTVQFSVQYCFPQVDIDATATVPNWVPAVGGKTGGVIKKTCASIQIAGGKMTAAVGGGAKLFIAERSGEFAASGSIGFCICPIKMRDAQVNVSGSLSFSTPPLQWPPASPLPLVKLEAALKPEIGVQVGLQEGDGECDLDSPRGSWWFQPVQGFFRPTLEGTLKVGQDYAVSGTGSAGISGGIKVQIPGNHQNYCLSPYISELKGTLFAKLTLCLFALCRESTWQWDFWNCPPSLHGFNQPYHERLGIWKKDERKYLNTPSGYMRLGEFHSQGGTSNEQMVVQNMYPHAFPSLATRSPEAIIVYSYDGGDETNQFDLQIGALHFNGSEWQFLPSITETIYPNLLPYVLYDTSGKPVCVWVGAPNSTGTETEPSQFLPSMEIMWSQYSDGTWSTPQSLTNNNYIDTKPLLIQGEDGVLTALWISQPGNQFPTIPGENVNLSCELWAADWNGNGFNAPYLLALDLPIMVTPAGLRLADGSLLLALNTDHDMLSNTTTDRELTLMHWFTGNANFTRLTQDAFTDTNPKLVWLSNGEAHLVWAKQQIPIEEGALGEVADELWHQKVYPAQGIASKVNDTPAITDLQVHKDDCGNPVALWTTVSKDGNDIYYALYQANRDTWTAPQQLTRDRATESMLTIGMLNNRILAAYLKSEGNLQDVEQEMPDGTFKVVRMMVYGEPDLYTLQHSPFTDLKISDIRLDGDSLPGATIQLDVDVSCLGDSDTSTVVAFYDVNPEQGGAPFHSETRMLRAGTQETFTTNYTLPQSHITSSIYAMVDPTNSVDESDEENNLSSLTIWAPDLLALAPEVEQYLSTGAIRMLVGIRNQSSVSPEGEVAWQLRKDNPNTGSLIAEEIVEIPSTGHTKVMSVVWDPGSVNPGRYSVYLKVDSLNQLEEEDEQNNTSVVEIALLPDLTFSSFQSHLTVGTGGVATVQTILQNLGWANAENVVVQVLNGPPGIGTVLASSTVPNLNRFENVPLEFNVSLANMSGSIWLVTNTNGSIDEVRFDNNHIVLLSPLSVSGRLVFNDYVGTPISQATIEFRHPGQTEAFGAYTVSLEADGSFVLPAPYGLFDLSVKIHPWLRQSFSVDTTNGSVSGLVFDLINGDVNGDDCIDDIDLLAILFAFGQTGENLSGDLNGDGSIDDTDLLLVLFNFSRGC